MKKIKVGLLSMVAVFGLSGCGSDCTEEELKEKLQELTVEIQGLAADGDMSKLMEFSQKAQKISQTTQDEDNIQAACEAVDELLDEL